MKRLLLSSLLLLSACGVPGPDENPFDEEVGKADSLTTLTKLVYVSGVAHDLETDYIPNVIQCENGGAPYQSKMAQAIAARTFLVATTNGKDSPSIGSGQQWQVYSCGKTPNADDLRAAQDTAGMILHWTQPLAGGKSKTWVTSGQFVAGAKLDANCNIVSDATNTERFVTDNEALSGSAIHFAPRPLADPSSPRNRGCMGQNMANCLATHWDYQASDILRYFYGLDIQFPESIDRDPPAQ